MLSDQKKEEPPGGYEVCPIVTAIQQMGSKWNLIVVRYLFESPRGFNDLLRTVHGLNSKTLSRVLKHLQEKGIIDRAIKSTQPFLVEYSLTAKGAALQPVMESLRQWGDQWILNADVKEGDGDKRT